MTFSPSTRRAVASLAGVALVCSFAALFVIPSLYTSRRAFEPYLTVVTDRSHADAAARLADHGVGEVIGPNTTEVHITRFGAIDTVTLSAALRQLDPRDPRRDPFIESLGRYFGYDGYQVLYAKIPGSLWSANRSVRLWLGSGSRVAEWFALPYLLSLGVLLLAGACAAYAYGRGRFIVALLVLPWIPTLLAGALAAAVASSITLVSVAWLHRRFTRRRFERGAGFDARRVASHALGFVCLAAISAYYVGVVAGGGATIAYVIGTVGSVGAAVLPGVVTRTRSLDEGHRPFVPLEILGVSDRSSAAWIRIVPVLWTILLVVPPLADRVVPEGRVPRPMIVETGLKGFDQTGLSRVWHARGVEALPDIADYLAHRAYQEGVGFGLAFGFPDPGQDVRLTRFRQEADGTYSSYRDVVLTFDQAWVDAAISSAAAGIPSLLVAMGRPVGVVFTPTDALYSRYSHIVHHVMYVLLTLIPFAAIATSRARHRWGGRPVLDVMRRRKQVA